MFPTQGAKPILALLLLAASNLGALADDGAAIFNLNCAPCHGKDGKAKTPIARKLGVKDLTRSTTSDGQIEQQIREGKKGADGKLQMPSFDDKISADQMKLLVRFVKGLRK